MGEQSATPSIETPVDMTVFMDAVPAGQANNAVNDGTPAGDCLRASVATVLGKTLLEVPHFVQYVEHPAGTDALWWWALVGYCHYYGWETTYHEEEDEAPKGWSLADGWSPRGHRHVCVAYDGKVVFDPHPSRSGLDRIAGWIGLSRLLTTQPSLT